MDKLNVLRAWFLMHSTIWGVDLPRYIWVAVATFAIFEWTLGKTGKVKPNSTIAILASVLGLLLGRIPRLGPLLTWIATPASLPVAASQPVVPAASPTNAQSGRVNLFLVATVAAGGIMLALLLGGCAPGANGARQTLTNIGYVVTMGYRAERAWLKSCVDKSLAVMAGDTGSMRSGVDHCERISKVLLQVLDVASDAVGAAADAIDVAERSKQKDYTGALAPLMAAIGDVAKAFADAGLPMPQLTAARDELRALARCVDRAPPGDRAAVVARLRQTLHQAAWSIALLRAEVRR